MPAFLLLALLVTPWGLRGQDEEAPAGPLDLEQRTIVSITFRYGGPKTVDESRLRDHMSVRVGQKYNPEILDKDAASLYESGLVEDVSFLGDPRGDESLALIVEVVTRGQIVEIGFVGNAIFSDRKLATVAEVKAGVISDSAILEARRKIEKQYKDYGYPDVLVSHRLRETDRAGQFQLVFVVEEGAKSEVRKILFEGNKAFSRVELKREMQTKQKGLLSFINKSGRIDAEKLQLDLLHLEDFYRNHGYRMVRIDSARREAAENGRVDLVIPIYEGPKYTVESVSFGKMTVFKSEELMPALSLVGGQEFSNKKVRDDVRMIRSYYGSRGYADAVVIPEMRDVSPGVVAITYKITEGTLYRVGKVNIQGNILTKDKVIRRVIPMRPGAYYNSVDEETTKRRLQNLRYFKEVQVSGSPSTQPGYRDVNILLSEAKTGQVSFGAGFSSIDSIVGYLHLEQTNFDIGNPKNFFRGGGQRFSTRLQLGNERRDVRISLIEPWFMGRKLSLGGEVFYRDLLFLSDEYDQSNAGGAIFIRRPLGRKGYIKAEYRLEKVGIDVEASVPPGSAFLEEDGDFLRSALSVNYVYDSRDSNMLPRRGHRFNLGASWAGGILGGDVETYSLSALGSKHWNLPWDIIFNLNGSVTVVDAISGRVPIFDRQMLGGARNLRGFDTRDVGPRDSVTGSVLGGNTAAYGTAEATFPIFGQVRGAVFGDIGFVNAGSFEFSPDEIHSDVGIGVRATIPYFGPMALDYAFPLQGADAADDGPRLQVYVNYQY
ncbi:MAG: outer membrane protein assembly factor BamA [Roseibacillus sp.]|nr:outer membrane protein assembly factor BamA [Roseibacillus sp.]